MKCRFPGSPRGTSLSETGLGAASLPSAPRPISCPSQQRSASSQAWPTLPCGGRGPCLKRSPEGGHPPPCPLGAALRGCIFAPYPALHFAVARRSGIT